MFIRGFRAKRILSFYRKMKAFAENLPDDPDNEPDSSIELIREPDVPEVGCVTRWVQQLNLYISIVP